MEYDDGENQDEANSDTEYEDIDQVHYKNKQPFIQNAF